MCGLIKANLELCRIPDDQAEAVQSEATEFLRTATSEQGGPWEIVFFDPPYATDYLGVLKLFGFTKSALLAAGGLLIVEHHHKNLLRDEVGSIVRSRILKQGDSALSFYKQSDGAL
jgi:16S rRNA G966 N2-methylase RsmD